MKQRGCSWLFQSICFLFFFYLLTTSCTHETIDLGMLDTVCFERDILSPLQSSCGKSGCHGGSSGVEGFAVGNYAAIMQSVTPGDPRGSKLYQVITDINGENFMPPDQPLSANQRNLIEVWILQGALETKCDTSTPDTGVIPPPPIDWGDSVCFVQDILPIFLPSCGTDRLNTGCHSVASHVEGYVLVDYQSIMNGEEGIVPNHADHSKFIEVLTTGELDERMPPGQPLSQAQIDLLTTWINEGALNSNCPDGGCDTLNAITYNNQVSAIFQNCVTCHNTPPGNGGILLNTYGNTVAATQVMRNGSSVLLGALRHLPTYSPMPSIDYQLSDCSIRTIELWINQGVLEQ
jgi:hypothetical protein